MYGATRNNAINQYNQVKTEASVYDVDAHRLVAMLLDGAVERLVMAKLHIEQGNIAEKGRSIGGSSAIILGLRDSLDMVAGGDISQNLYALYTYMLERLVVASIESDTAIIDELVELLKPVREGWNGIPPEARQQHAQRKGVAAL